MNESDSIMKINRKSPRPEISGIRNCHRSPIDDKYKIILMVKKGFHDEASLPSGASKWNTLLTTTITGYCG